MRTTLSFTVQGVTEAALMKRVKERLHAFSGDKDYEWHVLEIDVEPHYESLDTLLVTLWKARVLAEKR